MVWGQGKDKILGNQEHKNSKFKYLKNLIQNLLFFKYKSSTKKIPVQFKDFKEIKYNWPPCLYFVIITAQKDTRSIEYLISWLLKISLEQLLRYFSQASGF